MKKFVKYTLALILIAIVLSACASPAYPDITSTPATPASPDSLGLSSILEAGSPIAFKRVGTGATVYLGMSHIEVEQIFQTPAEKNSVKYYDAHSIQLSIANGEVFAIYVRTDDWTIVGYPVVGVGFGDIKAIFGDYGEVTTQVFGAPEFITSPFDILRYHFNEYGEVVDSQSVFVADFNIDEYGNIFSAGIRFSELPLLGFTLDGDFLPPNAFTTIFLEESGTGNAVLPVGMQIPGNGLTLTAIEHNGSQITITSNNMWAVVADGAYSGRLLLPEIDMGELTVYADGAWTIKVTQMVSMESENPIHGSGTDVAQFWLDSNDDLSISYSGTGRFAVYIFPQLDWENRRVLLDVIGTYSTKISEIIDFPGFYTLEILSEGDWHIERIAFS